MKLDTIENKINFKLTLILTVLILLLIGVSLKWKESLLESLDLKREELGESLALTAAGDQSKGKEDDIELFKKIKRDQEESESWTDSIAPLVAEKKLILRQVRPMGIEQKGKVREEKLFVQVDGSVDGILGFIHHLALQESAVYVSRYLITTRSVGTGFVSAEIVVSRLIL